MQDSRDATRLQDTGPGAVAADKLVLVGDIGGSKTRLAIFAGPAGKLKKLAIATYPSGTAASLEEIIGLFLQSEAAAPFSKEIADACFGVAGPVIDNAAKITNLDWTIDAAKIRDCFGFKQVTLINDMLALAAAVPQLKAKQLIRLNRAADPTRPGNIGLIAAGTGLGEALLIYDNGAYISCPSEGGHKDFAPRNAREFRLWEYLSGKYGHVSIERVLSGPGIADIYHFLRRDMNLPEPAWLTERLQEEHESAVITGAALEKKDPVCAATLDIFIETYGAEAGNLALHGLTTGGIYIGGGIGPKILAALKSGLFMKVFADKGRMHSLLADIPVRMIIDSSAALSGAAAHACSSSSAVR